MPSALVADNDPGVRALLGDLVRRSGFEMRAVADGSSARAALEAGGVDLLVCDLDMPGLSGQQLLAWITAQPRSPLVVVVSGYIDGGIERELAAYPIVRAVLRKPFDVFGFVQRVRELAKEIAAQQLPLEPSSTDAPASTRCDDPPPAGRDLATEAAPGREPADPVGSRPSGPAEKLDRPGAEGGVASDEGA